MRVNTATMAALGICLIASAPASAAPTFTKAIAAPSALDGVRAGMTLDEAKAALLSYKLDDTYKDGANRKRMIKDAGNGAKYYALLAGNVVARIGIEAPEPGLVAKLTKLWGAP